MKPETSIPDFNHEPQSVERSHVFEQMPKMPVPELDIQKSAEKFEQKSESGAVAGDLAGLNSTLPTPIMDDSAMISGAVPVADAPSIAGDDDLIEKEWVDKAKKIVADTRDDPYQREESIGKLQVDYMKKRYGRELGVDN